MPTPTERLRLYQLSSTTLDGSVTNIATLSTLGNDQLEPERTGEIEGGFDADLLRGRVSVELTGYRKLTRNAILGVRVAPSVYGLSSYETNVGTIRNEGLEASLHVDLLRTQAIRWSEEVHVSHNSNVLVSLNEGDAGQAFTGLRLREGYPVDAVWAYPLLGYADRNQNGVIGTDELLFGDTLAYMGSASPAYQVGVTTTIALWRNMLSLDASLGYRSGFTQRMNADLSYGISRGCTRFSRRTS